MRAVACCVSVVRCACVPASLPSCVPSALPSSLPACVAPTLPALPSVGRRAVRLRQPVACVAAVAVFIAVFVAGVRCAYVARVAGCGSPASAPLPARLHCRRAGRRALRLRCRRGEPGFAPASSADRALLSGFLFPASFMLHPRWRCSAWPCRQGRRRLAGGRWREGLQGRLAEAGTHVAGTVFAGSEHSWVLGGGKNRDNAPGYG